MVITKHHLEFITLFVSSLVAIVQNVPAQIILSMVPVNSLLLIIYQNKTSCFN